MSKTSNFWESLPKPILALAPMAGVTDLPFRMICHKYGADLVYSEMLMVQGLARRNEKTLRMAEVDKSEHPVVLQLGGNDPELFYKSAKIIREETQADGIDLNFGCPAKKIAGNGSGVALLRDLDRAYEIVQATIEGAGGLPVSLKTRTQIKSLDKKETISSLDLLKRLKDLPLSAVMIHGRSYEAPWIEEVDYEYIAKIKKIFSGLVLANGGIYSPEIAKKALDATNADGLGIAHGVYGRPWIFQQIKDYLQTGKYNEPDWAWKRKVAIEHARLAFKLKGPQGLLEYRKQLLFYVKGLEGAAHHRQKLMELEELKDIEKALLNIN